MKGSRLTSAIVGLALLGAASARAESAATQMSGWSAADAHQGSTALTSLTAAGVAESDVSDRMVEWQAKGATPARCAQLLTALAGAAGQSHDVLAAKGVSSRPDVVLAGADALVAGASREHLEKVVSGADTEAGALGRVSALTTLLAEGFAPGASSDAVALAAEHGYREHELVVLALSAGRLSREGVVARDAVLGHVSSAVRQGVQARELYPHVQQALHPHTGARGPSPSDAYNHEMPSPR